MVTEPGCFRLVACTVSSLGFRKPEALRRYHYGGASQVETLRCRLDHMFASVAATLHTQATARRGWSDAGKKLLDSLREFVCSTAEAAPPPDALFFSDVVAFSVDDVARSSCSMFCGIRQASDLGIVPVGLLPYAHLYCICNMRSLKGRTRGAFNRYGVLIALGCASQLLAVGQQRSATVTRTGAEPSFYTSSQCCN